MSESGCVREPYVAGKKKRHCIWAEKLMTESGCVREPYVAGKKKRGFVFGLKLQKPTQFLVGKDHKFSF